jgi:hypothetical protein
LQGLEKDLSSATESRRAPELKAIQWTENDERPTLLVLKSLNIPFHKVSLVSGLKAGGGIL